MQFNISAPEIAQSFKKVPNRISMSSPFQASGVREYAGVHGLGDGYYSDGR